MTISAVYCCRNEIEWLPLSIASIWDDVQEVVVLDNRSDDGTVEFMRKLAAEHPSKVKLVETGTIFDEVTEYQTRNKALSHCTGDWVMALDGDQILNDGWRRAVTPYMRDAQCECVGIKYRHCVGSIEFEHKPECGVPPHIWVFFRRTGHLKCRPASEVCEWAKPFHHASHERSCSPGSLRTCDNAELVHAGFAKSNAMFMSVYRIGRGDFGHGDEAKEQKRKEYAASGNPFMHCGPVERTIHLPQELPSVIRDQFGKYELTLSPTGHILSRRNTLTGELM